MATVLAVHLACALLPGEREYAEYGFGDFKREFDRSYASAIEEARAASTFARNLAWIRSHNAATDKSWYAAINRYADVEPQEFRAAHAGLAPMAPPTVKPNARSLPAADPPSSVDWRSRSVMTRVNDQKQCGSCWAFSAVETLESHLALATNTTPPLPLSTQQVVDCAPNPRECGGTGGCDGGLQSVAFNYSSNQTSYNRTLGGLALARSYPYTGETGSCHRHKPAATHDGYVTLPTNDYSALMSAVANLGPIAISVATAGLGWQFYGGGVFDGTSSLGGDACGFAVDHGVQLVGYGEISNTSYAAPDSEGGGGGAGGGAAAKQYWLVRNSWGSSWGEKGYMRLKRFGEGKEPCGKDKARSIACEGDRRKSVEYCGLCAVLSLSLYPTGVRRV